jgi:hypothetical protein
MAQSRAQINFSLECLFKSIINLAKDSIRMSASENEQAMERLRKLGMSEKAAEGLISMGITGPEDLKGKDPVALYERLRSTPGQFCEPCMLNQFKIAVMKAERL